MNKAGIIFLLLLLLNGCASVSDTRPEIIRKSEYYLEHGVTAFGNSDYVMAAEFFNKALAHYRSIDDSHGILLSLINLAETAMATGNAQAVIQRLEQAESVARRSQPSRYLDRIQLMRAQVYWREHDEQRVMPLLTPLLPEFSAEDTPERSPSLLDLTAIILRTDIAFSRIDQTPGEAKQWLRRLEASLARNSDTTPLHNARLSRFKALLAQRNGNFKKALELMDESLHEYRIAAVRPAIAATLTETARLYMGQKQWEKAEERLQRALYVRVWILDRLGSREVLHLLNAVYQEMGDEQRARLSEQYAQSINSDGTVWRDLQDKLIRSP